MKIQLSNHRNRSHFKIWWNRKLLKACQVEWRAAVRGPETQQLAPVPGPDRYNQHQPFEVLPEHSWRVLEFFEVSGWSTVPLSSPVFLLSLSFSLCPLSLLPLWQSWWKGLGRKWKERARGALSPRSERWRARMTCVCMCLAQLISAVSHCLCAFNASKWATGL